MRNTREEETLEKKNMNEENEKRGKGMRLKGGGCEENHERFVESEKIKGKREKRKEKER